MEERFREPEAYREQEAFHDFNGMKHLIGTAVIDAIKSSAIYADENSTTKRKYFVSDIEPSDGGLRLWLLDARAHPIGTPPLDIPLLMPRKGAVSTTRISSVESKDYRIVRLDEARISPESVEKVRAIFDGIFTSKITMDQVIPITDDDELKIEAFFDGLAGDPVKLSGSLWRMEYFGRIVITTVGFGDIVPISRAARGLVVLEAFFGLSFIGLMLNALAYRASQPRP